MKKLLLSVAVIATSFTSFAQVGIGTTTPKASLDVVGTANTATTTDGIIAPRLTGDQLIAKTAYGTDQTAAIVYVSSAPTVATTASTIHVKETGYYFFDGTVWQAMEAKGSGDGNNAAGVAGIGATYGTVASVTGNIWLDRNLGATMVSNQQRADFDSEASYIVAQKDSFGDLYQWGRAAEGHEDRGSVTNTTQAGRFIAGEGDKDWDGKFIIGFNNWLDPKVDNLWSGTSAENNPCPSGFRVPTNAELNYERLQFSLQNRKGAFNSVLKLPTAGARIGNSGELGNEGGKGSYWTSTVVGDKARFLNVNVTSAEMDGGDRADGLSVRCIKD